ERNHDRLERDHQGREDEEENDVAAAETQLGQPVARERGEEHGGERDGARHEHRVEQRAREDELAVVAPYRLPEVVEVETLRPPGEWHAHYVPGWHEGGDEHEGEGREHERYC